MSFVIAVFGYPVILAVLCLGAGLLVERAAGLRLPLPLMLAAGWASLIVLAQLTVLSGTTAPFTPGAFLILALLGFAFGRRRGGHRVVRRRVGRTVRARGTVHRPAGGAGDP